MPRLTAAALALACLLAGFAPLRPGPPPPSSEGFPGWPSTFEGRPLWQLPLTDLEQGFAHGFPGRLGRFTDGEREMVIRWVAGPTRLLHPAADCFRGAGYTVTPPSLEDGGAWAAFTAERAGQALRVRERILSHDGCSWTDVGAWYWTGSGPAWAWTVAARL